MGGESAAARDAQVAYLIDGAFEEYARRELSPNDVTFASLPTQRMDVQLNPNALGGGVTARASLSGPLASGALARGSVVETMSPVRAPLAGSPVGQGDDSTEEPDSSDATAGHAPH